MRQCIETPRGHRRPPAKLHQFPVKQLKISHDQSDIYWSYGLSDETQGLLQEKRGARP